MITPWNLCCVNSSSAVFAVEQCRNSTPNSRQARITRATVSDCRHNIKERSCTEFQLRIIIRISERLPSGDRIALLSDCVLEANDDTMAFRILTTLTGPHGDFNLQASLAELYPSFGKRMRKRYGRDVDAANIDLTTSDFRAFDYWAGDLKAQGGVPDPEDRATQRDFWLRYIGGSRSRLAQAFRRFLMPVAIYNSDPALVVEKKLPVADLKRLYEELPDDGTLGDEDRRNLKTLQRFLNGEFKDGIGMLDDQ